MDLNPASKVLRSDSVWLNARAQCERRAALVLGESADPGRCGRQPLPWDYYRVARAALRPPGPLRTGREGFPSPSSSPSNASLEETRFRNEKDAEDEPGHALG